jgi:hypothetical protein
VDLILAAAAIGPIAVFLVLLVLATRKLWRPARTPFVGDGPTQGRGPRGLGGTREPRRPLVPSASGAASLPIPEAEPDFLNAPDAQVVTSTDGSSSRMAS